jgi:hypothetical protein
LAGIAASRDGYRKAERGSNILIPVFDCFNAKLEKQESAMPLASSFSAQRSTVERCKSASLRPQNVIPTSTRSHLENSQFPEFGDIDEIERQNAELESAVQEFLKDSINVRGAQIVTDVMGRWFRASFPFAQSFLAILTADKAVSLQPFPA